MIKRDYINTSKTRILSILETYLACSFSMLQSKISEAGQQKRDPHIVDIGLKELLDEGKIIKIPKAFKNRINIPIYCKKLNYKYHRHQINQRLKDIYPYLDRLKNNKNNDHNKLHTILGKTLEISVYIRLIQFTTDHNLQASGKLTNYTSANYNEIKKIEPTNIINDVKTKGREDFLIQDQYYTTIAIIECKNIRSWIYPCNKDFRKSLQKAIDTNTILIYIARKTHFTMNIFRLCGIITYDTKHQIYPIHEYEFAFEVRNKKIIGYHDIAIMGHHDKRLEDFDNSLDRFFFKNLDKCLSNARIAFDRSKLHLQKYLDNEITLTELYQFAKTNVYLFGNSKELIDATNTIDTQIDILKDIDNIENKEMLSI